VSKKKEEVFASGDKKSVLMEFEFDKITVTFFFVQKKGAGNFFFAQKKSEQRRCVFFLASPQSKNTPFAAIWSLPNISVSTHLSFSLSRRPPKTGKKMAVPPNDAMARYRDIVEGFQAPASPTGNDSLGGAPDSDSEPSSASAAFSFGGDDDLFDDEDGDASKPLVPFEPVIKEPKAAVVAPSPQQTKMGKLQDGEVTKREAEGMLVAANVPKAQLRHVTPEPKRGKVVPYQREKVQAFIDAYEPPKPAASNKKRRPSAQPPQSAAGNKKRRSAAAGASAAANAGVLREDEEMKAMIEKQVDYFSRRPESLVELKDAIEKHLCDYVKTAAFEDLAKMACAMRALEIPCAPLGSILVSPSTRYEVEILMGNLLQLIDSGIINVEPANHRLPNGKSPRFVRAAISLGVVMGNIEIPETMAASGDFTLFA
jgi:hypothetical protein